MLRTESTDAPKPLLRAVQLAKSFPAIRGAGKSGASKSGVGSQSDSRELGLFRNLSFTASAGEMVAIVGESGSGKSSLLHLFAALDRPSSGEIWFDGREITALSAETASVFRNREVGYIWQFHYLLPEFSAAENVAMPLLSRGTPRTEALGKAVSWLQKVGLDGREEHRSGELSGGEQQRVAIARALITEPRLLLADEPTGDLDDSTAERVFALLQQLTRERHLATIVVTHNLRFAERCDRTLRLREGELHAVETAPASR